MNNQLAVYRQNQAPVDIGALPVYFNHGLKGIDTANNRVWGTCPQSVAPFAHVKPCYLQSVTRVPVGNKEPEIKARPGYMKYSNGHAHHFFAFPSPSTVVFGGYAARAGAPPRRHDRVVLRFPRTDLSWRSASG